MDRADGAGNPQRLAESESLPYTPTWHPDGKVLAFRQSNVNTGWDIMTLTIEGDEKSGWKPGKPKPFINSASDEGRSSLLAGWPLARLRVQPTRGLLTSTFGLSRPGRQGRFPPAAATFPKWSPDGKELIYRRYWSGGQEVMVATIPASGDIFRFEKPRLWSPSPFSDPRYRQDHSFDIHPDGKRFAVLKAPGTGETVPAVNKVSFIFNFFDELRGIAPPAKR